METKWDKRYREGFYDGTQRHHDLVEKTMCYMPRGKPVIDIAAGQGRDIIFLARSGFSAYGLEQSQEAIKLARVAGSREGAPITMVLGDARTIPFRKESAGTVIVFYFLIREIMSDLLDILAPGGILLYETFLKKQNSIDRARDPGFMLDDGELLSFFQDLDLLFYEEGIFTRRGKRRALARYAGRKRK